MSAVFLKLLNLSITASRLILAVILVRFLLKKAPKWISCVLWTLVALRLVCPFSFESTLSLVPSSQTIPANIEVMQTPAIDSGITIINEAINPVIAHSFTPDPQTSANPLQIIVPVLSVVWIAGMAAMLLYALISYIRLKKSVGASVPVRDNILACDEVKSPFILGIFRPFIYVPSSMEGEVLDYVVTHETAHIRRCDHWWKPLGFLLLAVYWFNPLCWLAYVLLCRDIEMACDEKVIQKLDYSDRAAYSQALLDCSFPRRKIAACPLAFGEVGVKERVKSVLNYRKPAFWLIVAAIAACIVIAVCFGTNPSGTPLTKWHITEADMRKDLDDVESLSVQYQDSEIECNESEINRFLATMDKIKIGRRPIGKSRDENRSAVFTITVDESLTLNFNEKFSELWVSKGVKPSYTYGIVNPSTAEELLLDFKFSAWMTQDAGKWFDCLHGDEMVDGVREIKLDAYPGVTFRCSEEKLEAVTDKETITLYTGLPILSVYFCDLNGDGKPELCSSVEFGFGLIDRRIIVADYVNNALYELSDRGNYNYVLTCKNGQLWAEIRAYMMHDSELYASGRLILKQGKLFVDDGVRPFSGSEVADRDALFARYAKSSEFDLSDTGGQSSQKNNPWFIIPDYFNRIMKAASSHTSPINTSQMSVNSLKYILPEELEQYNYLILLSSIEDAVILSGADQFAAFEVNYHLSGSDDPEMDAQAQYPPGNYMAVFILGKTAKSDSWEVITPSARIGINDN